MIRVGILGASGYTALEAIKILLRHSEAKVTVATSRQEGSPPIASLHPMLSGRLELRVEDLKPAEVASRVDCVLSCLPHAASAEAVMEIAKTGVKVIDFSADYRLNDAETYKKWYDHEHPDPTRLGKTVYGLPEWFRDSIRGANVVANPGCYPTSAILPLAPLIRAGVIETRDVIIDSKSGVSGAGRTPKLNTLYSECNESISAYSVGKHRHAPEIEQILGRATGATVEAIFTPHLTPMDRGILSVCYARPTRSLSEKAVRDILTEQYKDEPFVKVVEHLPATKDVAHTNMCHITARIVRDRILTISVIDNLIKGASGAAVQNFNLMFGFPETMGLT